MRQIVAGGQQPVDVTGIQHQPAVARALERILHGMGELYAVLDADDARRALQRMRRSHA